MDREYIIAGGPANGGPANGGPSAGGPSAGGPGNGGPATESIDARISGVCRRQHGVFSRTQAMRLGASAAVIRNRVHRGHWERVHSGVYRLAGVPWSWRQMLMAACLRCGAGAVASHQSAAALPGLAGFEEGPIEISARRNRQIDGAVVHRPASLPAVDVTVVHGIPATTVARTLLDLAATEPERRLEEALDDALRRGLVSLPRLRWRIAELGEKGRPGIVRIRDLVEARRGEPVPESVLETRLLRLMRRATLPRPVLQHEIRMSKQVVAVVDFAYPHARVAIEADGYRWHSGRARWQRDLARRSALASLGWRVLHVTWSDVTDRPNKTVERIAAALRARTD